MPSQRMGEWMLKYMLSLEKYIRGQFYHMDLHIGVFSAKSSRKSITEQTMSTIINRNMNTNASM